MISFGSLQVSFASIFISARTDKHTIAGIEDADDLIKDLDQAMQKAMALLESRKATPTGQKS